MLFQATKFVLICYSSNGKLIQDEVLDSSPTFTLQSSFSSSKRLTLSKSQRSTHPPLNWEEKWGSRDLPLSILASTTHFIFGNYIQSMSFIWSCIILCSYSLYSLVLQFSLGSKCPQIYILVHDLSSKLQTSMPSACLKSSLKCFKII